jgi:hypothetical protein
LGLFLHALHDLGDQGVRDHRREEADYGRLPGLEAAGEVVRFVREALDGVFDTFPCFVGVADEPVDHAGNSGGGDAGVLGDIADGDHCSSSARVPAGAA